MPLWGKNESKAYQGTTLAVTNGSTTITGTGTKFQVDLKPGDVLEIASGTTTKNRVSTITSNTVLVLADAFTGSTASLANTATTIQQLPKSAWYDSNTPRGANNNATIFGIDSTEISSGGDNITSVALVQGGTLYREAPPVTIAAPTLFTIPLANVSTADDTITSTAHGLSTGAKLTYLKVGATAITGLANNTAYYVIYVTTNTFKLASSAANALAGTAIDLTGTGSAAQTFQGDTATATVTVSANSVASITLTATGTAYNSTPAVTIAKSRLTTATANVSTSLDTVTYTTHGLSAADSVLYLTGGSTAATGLANNTTYYVATAGLTANAFELKAATTSGTLTATVATANTTGGFSCGNSTLAASDRVTITGTRAGTGTITGYVTGTTYKVSAVTGTSPNVSAFILQTEAGVGVVTTAGTLTGLTYTTETVIDISGTGNNAQYFEKVASTAATATAARGSGGNADQHSKASHVGWVKRTVGTGGRAGRVQYETLVAMSSITGDAADDLVLPDA